MMTVNVVVLGEKSSVAVQRDLMQRKHLAPWVFIGAAPSLTLAMAKKIFNFEVSEASITDLLF